VRWIGEIPEEWDVKQLRRDTPILRGASPRPIYDLKYFDEHGEYGWVRISDVTASDIFLETTEQKLSVLGSNLSVKLSPKDLFLSIAGSVGKPCITTIPCCIHDGFVYFPRLSMNKKFLFYIFKIGLCFQGLGKLGTQLNLNTETVGSIGVPFPTPNEQKQIALFLDKKTKIIDNEITKNQNLIKLLQEKRQSEINHAVTKGLDDTVPMKDSKILGLTQIPKTWKEINLGLISTLYVPMRDKPKKFDGDIPWLKIDDITGKYASDSLSKQYVTQDMVNRMNLKVYPIGTVLCSCSATIGFCAITTKKLITNQTFIGIHPNKELNNEFLFYFLKTQIPNLRLLGVGATILYISREKFEKLKIIIPKKTEQKQIVSYLDKKTAKIDSLISKIQLQISNLQEFRESLISSAVTGKIQVAQA